MAFEMKCENCFYNNAAQGLAVPMCWCFLYNERRELNDSCDQYKPFDEGCDEL